MRSRYRWGLALFCAVTIVHLSTSPADALGESPHDVAVRNGDVIATSLGSNSVSIVGALGVEPLYVALRGAAQTIKEVGQKIGLPYQSAQEAPIRYVTALGTPTPNPFNPRVQLSFSLAAPTHVQLKVYDVRGRLVKTVVSGQRGTGQHAEVWNGDDQNGRKVASGVYFARFEAGSTVQVQRMVLVR